MGGVWKACAFFFEHAFFFQHCKGIRNVRLRGKVRHGNCGILGWVSSRSLGIGTVVLAESWYELMYIQRSVFSFLVFWGGYLEKGGGYSVTVTWGQSWICFSLAIWCNLLILLSVIRASSSIPWHFLFATGRKREWIMGFDLSVELFECIRCLMKSICRKWLFLIV